MGDSWSQYNYDNELIHDTKNIVAAFANLVIHTLESFVDKVPLKRIALWLKQLESLTKTLPLLSERMERIRKAEDMEQLFFILSDCWSWYNKYILENLINEFGDQENMRRLTQYCEKFTSFLKKRLINSHEHFSFGNEPRIDQKPMLIKVDENWNTISLREIGELHHNIARILDVPAQMLYLSSVYKGCISLNFIISPSVAEYALQLSTLQMKALMELHVLKLEYGRECVWEVNTQ